MKKQPFLRRISEALLKSYYVRIFKYLAIFDRKIEGPWKVIEIWNNVRLFAKSASL